MEMNVIVLSIVGAIALTVIAFKVRKAFNKTDCGSCCSSCAKSCKKTNC